MTFLLNLCLCAIFLQSPCLGEIENRIDEGKTNVEHSQIINKALSGEFLKSIPDESAAKTTKNLQALRKCIFEETSKQLDEILEKVVKHSEEKPKQVVENPVLKQKRSSTQKTRKTRQETHDKWNQCVLKSELEEHKFLENSHIISIKQELQKLQELVRLLRDQQYILNMLNDYDNKPQSKGIQEQKEIIEILNYLKDNFPREKSLEPEGKSEDSNSVNDEKIKIENLDLRKENENSENFSKLAQEISQLKHLIVNKSLQEVRNENNEERLKHELEIQKKELLDLQNAIDKVRTVSSTLEKNTGKNETAKTKMRMSEPESEIEQIQYEIKDLQNRLTEFMSSVNSTNRDSNILGSSLPKSRTSEDEADLQNLLNLLDDKKPKHKIPRPPNTKTEFDELEKQLNQISQPLNKKTNIPPPNLKARAGGDEFFENLQKLLENPDQNTEFKKIPTGIDLNSDNDFENRVTNLQKQLELSRKLQKVEKKIQQLHEAEAAVSKTVDEDDDAVKKRLKKIESQIKKLGKTQVQSKDLEEEDDLENELKSLQKEINKLKPKSDDELTEGKIGTSEFQIMLNKLIASDGGFVPHVPVPVSPHPSHQAHLSPAQIQILKTKLMGMKRGGYGGGGNYHGNSDYGAGTGGYGGAQYAPARGGPQYGTSGGGGVYGGVSRGGPQYGPAHLYGANQYALPQGNSQYGAGNAAPYGAGGGQYSSSSGPYGSGNGPYGSGGNLYGAGKGYEYGQQYSTGGGGRGFYGPQFGTTRGGQQYGGGPAISGYDGGYQNKYGSGGGSYGTKASYGSSGASYDGSSGGSTGNQYDFSNMLYNLLESPSYGGPTNNVQYSSGPTGSPYGAVSVPYSPTPYAVDNSYSAPFTPSYGYQGNPYGKINEGAQYGAPSPYNPTITPYGSHVAPYNPGIPAYKPSGNPYNPASAPYGVEPTQHLPPYTSSSGGANYQYESNNHGQYSQNVPQYGSVPDGPQSQKYETNSGAEQYSTGSKTYQANTAQSPYGSVNNPSPNIYTDGKINAQVYKPQSPNPYINVHNIFEHLSGGYQGDQPKNQFFQGYQMQGYQKPGSENYVPPNSADASNPTQSYANPQQNPSVSSSYAQEKVGDLKTQIYSLQHVIDNLNRPEYVKKPEDQQVVYKLDKKINDLKAVVNHLSQDASYPSTSGNSGYQQGVDKAYNARQTYHREQAGDEQFFEDSRRKKRSMEGHDLNQSNGFWDHLGKIMDFISYLFHGQNTKRSEEPKNSVSAQKFNQNGPIEKNEKFLTKNRRKRSDDENEKPSAIDDLLDQLGDIMSVINMFYDTFQQEDEPKNNTEANSTSLNRKSRALEENQAINQDTLVSLFKQLSKMIDLASHLTKNITQGNCACGVHKKIKSYLMRKKRENSEEENGDDSAEKALTKMTSFFKDLVKGDDAEDVKAEEVLENEAGNNNFIQKESFDGTQLQEKLQELKKQLEAKLQQNMNLHQSRSSNNNNNNQRSSLQEDKVRSSDYGQPSYYPQPSYSYYPQPQYYQQSYDYGDDKKKSKKFKLKKKSKKDDILDKIFSKILEKILDKIEIAIPEILYRLFGLGVDEIVQYGKGDYGYEQDSYGGGGGYGEGGYGVQKGYKKLGIFSYIPMIILKILTNFSYFVKLLQKNKFIKTFLVPALITGGTAGMIVFLVWWLSGDEQYGYGYNNNYGYSKPSGYEGGNNYRSSSDNKNDEYYNLYYDNRNNYLTHLGENEYSANNIGHERNFPIQNLNNNRYRNIDTNNYPNHLNYNHQYNQYRNKFNNNNNLL